MLDPEGSVVGKHSGARTVQGFEGTMSKASKFVQLRDKAASGDKVAQVDYLIARAQMGQLTADELETEAKKHTLTDEQQQLLKGVRADSMMDEVMRTAVGKGLLKMEKEGMIPGNASKRSTFYYYIFNYGAYKKDVQLMERAFKEIEKDPRYARSIPGLKKRIEAAKK